MRSAADAVSRRVLLATHFGDGSHFAAACAARAGALHYLCLCERVPPAPSGAQHAALRAQWPTDVPGWHRLTLDDGAVTLDLLVGAQHESLAQLDARIDAFYVPATGELPPLRALARLALPGATLLLARGRPIDFKALRSAGFEWPDDAEEGDLAAVYTSRKPQPPRPASPVRQAIVIGAGVAGAAACERLAARGWDVTLVERHGGPAEEASGNRAGIFMPLLSKDDNIPTRLSRAAYLYALRRWRSLGGFAVPDSAGAIAGDQCGVLQLARDAAHAQVQRDVAAHWNYPDEYVRWLDAPAASAVLGAPTPHGGWLFAQGGWATPASVCRAMLDACGARLRRLYHSEALRLERDGDAWRVLGDGGAVIARGPNVIVANGAGALSLAHTAALPLATMRGQVTHLAAADFPHLPLVVCREAYMTPVVDGIVCVGATYESDGERALRDASQQENLARARDILPGSVRGAPPLAGRVGFRCMAPDRLPLVGALPDDGVADGVAGCLAGRLERLRDVPRHPGLYSLLGYASRGLIWAPLAAEVLASQLEHEPPPLESTLLAALDPARFHLKSRRRPTPTPPPTVVSGTDM